MGEETAEPTYPRVRDAAEGFQRAQRLIAECKARGAEELDLGGLRLTELPEEILALGQLKRLYLGGDAEWRQSGYYFFAERCNALRALPRGFGDAFAQLEALDLSWNEIGAAGAAHLGQLAGLTTLILSGNQIGDAGAAHLGQLADLTRLDLSRNQIGDAGAAHLGQLAGLTTLDLSLNRIGAAGAAHLGQLAGLATLDLRGNEIGDAGAAHLGQLAGLTTLGLGMQPDRR